MQPPQLADDAPPRLIEANGFFSDLEFFFGGLIDGCYLFRSLGASLHDGGFTHRMPIQGFDDLDRAFQWHKLILVEVHQLRLEPRTILHRLCHRLRKLPGRLLVAAWTRFDLCLMLRDLYSYPRHFKHLPLFLPLHGDFFQRSMAMPAFLHSMKFNLIW